MAIYIKARGNKQYTLQKNDEEQLDGRTINRYRGLKKDRQLEMEKKKRGRDVEDRIKKE